MNLKEIAQESLSLFLEKDVKFLLKTMVETESIAAIAKEIGIVPLEILLWEVTYETAYEQAKKLKFEYVQRKKEEILK